MKDLYSFLLRGREQDSQRYWVIFGVMNVINGGLFGFATSNTKDAPLNFFTPLLGIGLCICWFLGVRRMSGWVKWWEKKLELIEPQYFSEIETKLPDNKKFIEQFKIFQNRKNAVTDGCSTQILGCAIPIIFFIAWALLLLYTLCNMLCSLNCTGRIL